jgi:hypothetical protein
VELEVTYAESAFRHGFTESDIEWAFKTLRYDALLECREPFDVYLLIGFSTNASIIEVMYNKTEDGIKVFHAMKCRSQYLPLISLPTEQELEGSQA